ncbi:MAG: sigma-70 family RNA polymerase sigma factor [Prevotella sp.]|nr:sigma-70 family RNA polymerase sigma factor [Prevotella sp.]
MTTEEYTKEAQRLRPLLISTAMRYLHSEKDADDIVQDALLRLWQMRPTLRLPIEPLAVVVVRNLCISHLRKQHITRGTLTENIADAGDDASAAERIERVMNIIDTLPDTQQTLLRLRHMDGMDSKSIAQMTGSSDTAVRKALSRARIAVREQYLKRYNSTKTHNSDEE